MEWSGDIPILLGNLFLENRDPLLAVPLFISFPDISPAGLDACWYLLCGLLFCEETQH